MSPELRRWLVIGTLSLLGLLLVVMGRAIWRETRTRKLTIWQWIFWWLAYYLVRVQWRCSGPRSLHLPNDGRGVVFISNHRSSIDPFYITILPDRVIRWMVAKEYVDNPFFGFFLKRCEVIPAKRGGIDNAATRSAIAIAKAGGYVGMFPEGRLNHTDEFMLSVRPGAILVALRANAYVVPVYIENSPYNKTVWSPFLMFARSSMRVGEPIDLSQYEGKERDSETIRELLLQCVGEIAKLGGEPGFVPEIAGRRWRDQEADPTTQEEAGEEIADEVGGVKQNEE